MGAATFFADGNLPSRKRGAESDERRTGVDSNHRGHGVAAIDDVKS
ncbi:hypothetical protein [Haladaptatus sp. DYF46]|nr:hypothetical protein [Haladaptatus sp. DYF46]